MKNTYMKKKKIYKNNYHMMKHKKTYMIKL